MAAGYHGNGVSSRENYFLTDGLYRHQERLSDTTEVQLLVLELRPEKWPHLDPSWKEHKSTKSGNADSNQYSDSTQWSKLLQDQLCNKPYVLDIDLDFFSTQNPFREMLCAEAEEAVRRLYYTSSLSELSEETLAEAMTERENHLALMETVWSCADNQTGDCKDVISQLPLETGQLQELLGLEDSVVNTLTEKQQSDIKVILKSVLQSSEETTFTQVHDFGCTLDDTELPHHVSTEEQVQALCSTFCQVLEQLPQPAIVTIARSSVDEYCPPSHVDQYERMVLRLLEKLYGVLDVTRDVDR